MTGRHGGRTPHYFVAPHRASRDAGKDRCERPGCGLPRRHRVHLRTRKR